MPALEPPPTRDEDLRRIAEQVGVASGALEVWVFGSVARGEAREDSDLDLLLVLEDDANPLEAAERAQRTLSPRRFAVDFVPILKRHFENPRNVLMAQARPEMRVLYGR